MLADRGTWRDEDHRGPLSITGEAQKRQCVHQPEQTTNQTACPVVFDLLVVVVEIYKVDY